MANRTDSIYWDNLNTHRCCPKCNSWVEAYFMCTKRADKKANAVSPVQTAPDQGLHCSLLSNRPKINNVDDKLPAHCFYRLAVVR